MSFSVHIHICFHTSEHYSFIQCGVRQQEDILNHWMIVNFDGNEGSGLVLARLAQIIKGALMGPEKSPFRLVFHPYQVNMGSPQGGHEPSSMSHLKGDFRLW